MAEYQGEFEMKHPESESNVEVASDKVRPIQYNHGTSTGKQQLRRNFGFMSILGFSCTALITWEGMLILFGIGLQNGGSAGLIYGYLFVWFGTLSVFSCLAELESMSPTSAGQYYWTSLLAPSSMNKYISYITGWVTVCGWQAAAASAGFATGSFIQSLIEVIHPDYSPQPWQTVLLFWAVITFAVFINAVVSSLLPKFEAAILVLHVVGFFAILLPLVITSEKSSAYDVFTSFTNTGGFFGHDGLAFFVGLSGNIFAFIGADGAVHMSEEVKNPAVVVPRSIVTCILLNGVLGFAMCIAVLFCIGDIEAALAVNPAYPLIGIFYNGTGSLAGAAVMSALLIVLAACSTTALLASASRMLWAFARDKTMPGWHLMASIDQRAQVPLWSIGMTTLVSVLLSLIILGSTVAFNDIVSLSIAGLFASYLIAAALLLYRRLTGFITTHDTQDFDRDTGPVNIPGQALVWGPWRLPGWFGLVNNIVAVAYLIIILFFSFWPPATPVVDPSTMNYSSVMLVGIMVLATIWYFVGAKRLYTGPKAAHLAVNDPGIESRISAY